MKIITIIFCITINCLAQQDSVSKEIEDIPCFQPSPDVPIQLIGGIDSLQARIIYPIEALNKKIEGTCYVLINVDTLGIPTKPFLIKGIGYGCDEEAMRLIMTSKYLPGSYKSKPIRSQIVIKVVFKLPGN